MITPREGGQSGTEEQIINNFFSGETSTQVALR